MKEIDMVKPWAHDYRGYGIVPVASFSGMRDE
jgi:hypothetical protein